MVSVYWFIGLVFVLIIQRLVELRISNRNEQIMKKQGGFECYSGHYPVMVLLHSSWFVSMLVEVWFFTRAPVIWLVIISLTGLILGQVLRWITMKTLKFRWSTRIYVVPDSPLIQDGIFRYLRHPNYIAVVLEIVCVPLIHSAYFTAAIWSVFNLFFLKHRIRLEETALKNQGVVFG